MEFPLISGNGLNVLSKLASIYHTNVPIDVVQRTYNVQRIDVVRA